MAVLIINTSVRYYFDIVHLFCSLRSHLIINMQKGGRPRDPVWAGFEESLDKTKVKCKTCQDLVSNKVERMRSHLKKCPAGEPRGPVSSVQELIGSMQQLSSVPPARDPVQSTMWSHIMNTSNASKEKLDLIIAELFFGCNLPFTLVEHPLFIVLVESLRPGYKPPTRKTLSGPLLDRVHSKLQTSMKAKLEGKTVTMQQDGWSTLQNDPVIATSVTCGDNGYFIDAQCTADNHKSAEYCKELLVKSKAYAEETYGCHVRTVVTDNAASMVKMREALQEEENLITYGCLAHWLNLLGNDLTPQGALKNVIEINKYFRNHHIPSSLLNDCSGSIRPQLPGDTRWKSQLNSIDSYIRNRIYMIKIIQENPNDIDDKIQKKVLDTRIYTQLRKLQGILRPVATALDRAQSDVTTLADAYSIMQKLMSEPSLASDRETVRKRRDKAILPCHMAAYMLHPKYCGQGMDIQDVETAKNWLMELNPDFLIAALSFQAEADPYPKSFFQPKARTMMPSTWWTAVGNSCKQLLPDGFVELMVTLHVATASSASLERIFSSFGLVITKLRNKLGLTRAQKLVFCYRMLRGPRELDYVF